MFYTVYNDKLICLVFVQPYFLNVWYAMLHKLLPFGNFHLLTNNHDYAIIRSCKLPVCDRIG